MCTSPLKAFPIGITSNGKTDYKICSWSVDHLEVRPNGSVVKCLDDTYSPFSIEFITNFVQIPCGQCAECRMQRSRQWANRCLLEQQYHPQSLFLTLTYDDEHLPRREVITPDGEIVSIATLVKEDMSKFMKALRQEYAKTHDNKLRFFGCGEYGSETFRPHFHIIVFGLILDDLKFYKKNFLGDDYFTSETIQKCWCNRGFCVIGDCTWESCAYTARYIMKKLTGKAAQFYSELGIEPEFVNMSRRPGIARQYYEDHPEMWEKDFISISTGSGGRDIFPPKYFEKLFEADFPELVLDRKAKKEVYMQEKTEQILANTDLNYLDYLKQKEYNIDRKMKSLPRKEI